MCASPPPPFAPPPRAEHLQLPDPTPRPVAGLAPPSAFGAWEVQWGRVGVWAAGSQATNPKSVKQACQAGPCNRLGNPEILHLQDLPQALRSMMDADFRTHFPPHKNISKSHMWAWAYSLLDPSTVDELWRRWAESAVPVLLQNSTALSCGTSAWTVLTCRRSRIAKLASSCVKADLCKFL